MRPAGALGTPNSSLGYPLVSDFLDIIYIAVTPINVRQEAAAQRALRVPMPYSEFAGEGIQALVQCPDEITVEQC